MAKLVSDPPDIPPWQPRTAVFRLVAEPDCRFADYLQFTLNSGHGHGVGTERLEIHSTRELLDHRNRIGDVGEQAPG
jgi:hypothetical protein